MITPKDHIHSHDHLFTVISGEIEIRLDGKNIVLSSGKSLRVPGNKLHSVWNVSREIVKVSGITLTGLTSD